MTRSCIIDLVRFTPDALPDATLNIYPGLGPACAPQWVGAHTQGQVHVTN